jgi:hypothetical protein
MSPEEIELEDDYLWLIGKGEFPDELDSFLKVFGEVDCILLDWSEGLVL